MVLQDIGDASTSSDGFADNPYPSDSDPYSSSTSSSSSNRRFDPSLCAQPIPILGPLFGFPERLIRYRTETTINFAEKKLGRTVTQEEAQALATHLYQMESATSYFAALGVGLGAWRCYNTAAVNRFPMYLPKPENINPNKFLFVKGPFAQYARHSARASLYMFVAGEFGKLCGKIVAQPIAARNTSNDPRMTSFTEDLRNASAIDTQKGRDVAKVRSAAAQEAAQAQRRERQDGRGQQQLPGGDQTDQKEPSRNSWPQRRTAAASSQDDMSPTAGNDSWSSTSDGNSSFSSDTTQDSASTQEPYQRTQAANSWSRQTRPPESDDASPTGGLFQDEIQNQSKPGESSWERLRRAGGPGPIPGQRPPSRRSDPQRYDSRGDSSSSDSFPFVDSGEDRNNAQAKAQEEFDARMQREREGKDFNEEKRW